MSLIISSSNCESKKVIEEKFNFLCNLFDFDPNSISPYKIEIAIINSLEEFLKIYEKEYSNKPQEYVVGFAATNGRIFILNENLFEKKEHLKKEFEEVITHELCHIFTRRILDPKSTFRWIEEGICEYLAFKNNNFKVSNPIDFKKLEDRESWRKFHPYQQSAAFFKFLSNNYGMKKIVKFIKLIKEKNEYEAFNELFGDFEDRQKEFFKSLKDK